MAISIGRFKERIIIQTYTDAKQANGEVIRSWATLRTLWAQYKSLGGNEAFQSDEKTAQRTAEFWIRYQGNTDINEAMRLIWDNQVFNIISINKNEFDDVFKMRCISKDNNA